MPCETFSDPLWALPECRRDNDRAADAMGMHPGLTKVYAFGLAGFFAGMAGALHAYVYRGVGFESFTLHHSITYLAMAIVGGLGTLTDLSGGRPPSSRSNCRWKPLPNTPVRYCRRTGIWPRPLKPFSFGLVIVLFLMFEPRGSPTGGASCDRIPSCGRSGTAHCEYPFGQPSRRLINTQCGEINHAN
jgi:hypothetical protein